MPSDEFDLLSYYKDLYEKEVAFSERLNSKLPNAITLLTIIGSGHVLLIAEMFPMQCPLTVHKLIALLLCALSGGVFLTTLFKFKGAYSGFQYCYFPIQEMEKTIKFAEQQGMGAPEVCVINKRLVALYREGAIHNRNTNREKSEKQLELNGMIVLSFCVLMIIFIAWFIYLKDQIVTATDRKSVV